MIFLHLYDPLCRSKKRNAFQLNILARRCLIKYICNWNWLSLVCLLFCYPFGVNWGLPNAAQSVLIFKPHVLAMAQVSINMRMLDILKCFVLVHTISTFMGCVNYKVVLFTKHTQISYFSLLFTLKLMSRRTRSSPGRYRVLKLSNCIVPFSGHSLGGFVSGISHAACKNNYHW